MGQDVIIRSEDVILADDISSLVKCTFSVREVWGAIFQPVKSDQCHLRLAAVATFFQNLFAQTLSREDGPRQSLGLQAFFSRSKIFYF